MSSSPAPPEPTFSAPAPNDGTPEGAQAAPLDQPLVSVLTLTRNRSFFWENMERNVARQAYPRARMEWIVVDDSTEPLPADQEAVWARALAPVAVRVVRMVPGQTIGHKRNCALDAAAGEIGVFMDDDDLYPPQRVEHVVYTLLAHPALDLVGTSTLFMQFPDRASVVRVGPSGPRRATAATMGLRLAAARRAAAPPADSAPASDPPLRFLDDALFGEERGFTRNFTVPLGQLRPEATVLALHHGRNTANRSLFMDHPYLYKVYSTGVELEEFLLYQMCFSADCARWAAQFWARSQALQRDPPSTPSPKSADAAPPLTEGQHACRVESEALHQRIVSALTQGQLSKLEHQRIVHHLQEQLVMRNTQEAVYRKQQAVAERAEAARALTEALTLEREAQQFCAHLRQVQFPPGPAPTWLARLADHLDHSMQHFRTFAARARQQLGLDAHGEPRLEDVEPTPATGL